jgi:hypothetical protein
MNFNEPGSFSVQHSEQEERFVGVWSLLSWNTWCHSIILLFFVLKYCYLTRNLHFVSYKCLLESLVICIKHTCTLCGQKLNFIQIQMYNTTENKQQHFLQVTGFGSLSSDRAWFSKLWWLNEEPIPVTNKCCCRSLLTDLLYICIWSINNGDELPKI